MQGIELGAPQQMYSGDAKENIRKEVQTATLFEDSKERKALSVFTAPVKY